MGVFSELDMEMRENGVSFAGENPFAETKPVIESDDIGDTDPFADDDPFADPCEAPTPAAPTLTAVTTAPDTPVFEDDARQQAEAEV